MPEGWEDAQEYLRDGTLLAESLRFKYYNIMMKKFFKNRCSNGFTLIEITVVIFIIGLLVAIGLPHFLRIKMNSNEKLILSDLRVFSNANESYRAFQRSLTYAPDLATLRTGDYINNTWIDPGRRNGYRFIYAPSDDGTTYSMEADPLELNATGVHTYCVDQTGVTVRSSEAGIGTAEGCVGGEPLEA